MFPQPRIREIVVLVAAIGGCVGSQWWWVVGGILVDGSAWVCSSVARVSSVSVLGIVRS